MADESLRIVSANEVMVEDLQEVFGQRGPAASCQCQRYRLLREESFGGQPVEERRHRLREQAGCGDPDAETDVRARRDLSLHPQGFSAPRPRLALVAATVALARDRGARAVEGCPIARTDVLTEELHVGAVPMFEQAGYRQVSAPTPRRLVMRRDFETARHWVIVASRDHAGRGVDGDFIMANPGKRAPRATLRAIEPLPLAQIREHLPASRLRFGFFELDAVDADAILALVSD